MKITLLALLTIFSAQSAEHISCNLKYGSDSVTQELLVTLPGENIQPVELKIKKINAKVNASYVLGDNKISLKLEFKTKRKFVSKNFAFSKKSPISVDQERANLSCKEANVFDDVLGRNAEVFKLAGNDPNSFIGSESLLYFAAKNKNERLVSYLLTLGANSLNSNISGNTPLMAASSTGNIQILKNIFESNPNSLDLKNKIGWNALMFAAKNNNIDGLNFLIEKGLNLDVQDKYGRTALMISSKLGFTSIVDRLIQAGAKLDLARNNGMTAFMLAHKYNHNEILTLLKKAGASELINLDLAPDFDWDLENEESYYNQ
ncbi:MAG: ankyrin repeat domain-containing protein [Bacteriovoracales bacterium]